MNRPKLNSSKNRSNLFFYIYDINKDRRKVQTGSSDKNFSERLIDDYMRVVGLDPDDPVAHAIDNKIYKVYFRQEKSRIQTAGKLLDPIFSEKERILIDERLGDCPDILIKLTRLIVESDKKSKLITKQGEELQGYDQLRESIIAKQISASKNCPSFTDCIDEFELQYRDNVSYSQCNDVCSMARILASDNKESSPATITRHQIRDFIMKLAKDSDSPEYRKKKVRSLLSPFFTWVSDRYDFQSPIIGLVIMKKKITEKPKITWHDLPVIEEVLSGLDSYWSAIIATMAYAGIGVKELTGIRKQDFIKTVKKVGKKEIEVYHLKIEWHEKRGLKTKNRSDSVPVDANYLLPRLLKYVDDGHAGKEFMFPKLESMRKTDSEMWQSYSLSQKLVGRKYPKDKETGEQKVKAGILPEGMLARDLRHTFGSLLIRNGYSIDEACALTRNQRDVFIDHYGHLTASELSVSFTGDSKKIQQVSQKSVYD